MDTGKKEKKRISPKSKKIFNIIVTSLQVAVVVATVAISIFVWTTTGRGDSSGEKPIQMLAIRSNSMAGGNPDSFNAGDLVIIKAPENASELTAGTVVTFRKVYDSGVTALITHRIFSVDSSGDEVLYVTKGDNVSSVDLDMIQPGDIVGVYSSKIKGIGAALLWLQGFKRVDLGNGDYGWDYVGNTNNFLYVIIIPLIALLLWNGYAMIRVIMEGKIKKARDEAAAAAVAASASGNAAALDAEEIKRRAIEEYLASLSADKATVPEAPEAPAVVEQPEAPAPQEPVAVEAEPEQNSPLEKGGSILSEENAQNGGFDKQPAKPAPKAAPKTPAKAPAKTAAKAPAKKPKSE